MPEGDTVHKIAGFLLPRLTARTLRQVDMADTAAAQRCAGQRVHTVHARGKHLFIELDNGTALRSHLGMYGAWHYYAPGAEWRKPRKQASLVLATEDTVYVCFNAREVELVRAPSVRQRIIHTRLGPDLIAAGTRPQEVAARARAMLTADALLADALLDQRIASGIGNVYKSEVLFIEGHLPTTPLAAVSDPRLTTCYATAADLLKRNLGGGKRVTRFANDGAGRLWAYRRRGLPCLRCDGTIEYARLGRHHRSTYWCPDCQS